MSFLKLELNGYAFQDDSIATYDFGYQSEVLSVVS